MENNKIEEFDDEWEGISPEDKEVILLLEMFNSALVELCELKDDMPTDQEIYDHLFKGNRQYKEVRRTEELMKEVVLSERLHLLGIVAGEQIKLN